MELENHEKLVLTCLHEINGRALQQDICKRVRRKMFPTLDKSVPKTAGHFAATATFLGKLIRKGLVQEFDGEVFALTIAGRNEIAAWRILRT